jgi:metal-sulfur cluster biosynthetic enzyme
MAKITAPEVGSLLTTAKSKVTGEVQEVVKNANGTYRVRLDVKGQPRWTTLTK